MKYLARCAPSLFCLAAAVGLMAYHGPEASGWGWLLVLAVIFFPGPAEAG